MIRFSFLFLLEHENLSQGSQAFHCFSLSLPLLSFTGLDTHLSLLSYSSLPLPGWNSDHGCCFISSLHFSLLLRLMVCCAINDSAKSGHSIKEGDWTGGGGPPHSTANGTREVGCVCVWVSLFMLRAKDKWPLLLTNRHLHTNLLFPWFKLRSFCY